MQKQNSSKPYKCPSHRLMYPLFIISLLTLAILSFHIYYPDIIFSPKSENFHSRIALPYSLTIQISNLQHQVGILLTQLRTEDTERTSVARFSDQVTHIAVSLDKLADSLSRLSAEQSPEITEMSHVQRDYSEPEEGEEEEEMNRGRVIFKSGEISNYTSPKLNRIPGKKTFLGVEAINPTIGMPCAHMTPILDQFMNYKIHSKCPDDSNLAQKLIVGGCEPLPRRRCFTRTPPLYTKPQPLSSSMWTQPSDSNILWSNYKCKNYSCLVSPTTAGNRGFFKCSDCFDLSKRGWEVPKNESASAEFTIDQVLALKTGEIRVGLDFSPSTGTFAAIMKERNVTIASATLNLGAPFNEVIALRGLIAIHISVGSRLPFYDNTLDIVHSTLFLDGWITVELLQFVLYDWDRVLRPKGLLWIDRFFCKKEDVGMYGAEFSRLGYKKLLWRIVPKTDKLGDEVFLSAVLEKPIRA